MAIYSNSASIDISVQLTESDIIISRFPHVHELHMCIQPWLTRRYGRIQWPCLGGTDRCQESFHQFNIDPSPPSWPQRLSRWSELVYEDPISHAWSQLFLPLAIRFQPTPALFASQWPEPFLRIVKNRLQKCDRMNAYHGYYNSDKLLLRDINKSQSPSWDLILEAIRTES